MLSVEEMRLEADGAALRCRDVIWRRAGNPLRLPRARLEGTVDGDLLLRWDATNSVSLFRSAPI